MRKEDIITLAKFVIALAVGFVIGLAIIVAVANA